MKIHKIHPHYLDKCMAIITEHCFSNPQQAFTGEELEKFCSKSKNVYALQHLASMDEVRLIIPNNSTIPVAVFLEKAGVLHSYVRRENRSSALMGFVLGVISTTVIPYLFNQLVTQLPQWLSLFAK